MKPDRFREIREGLMLTQDEIAEVLGVADKTVISRYEAGNRSPSKLMASVMEILISLPSKDSQRLMGLLKKFNNASKKP